MELVDHDMWLALFLVASGADAWHCCCTYMALRLVACLSTWVLLEEYLDAVWIVLFLGTYTCLVSLPLPLPLPVQ